MIEKQVRQILQASPTSDGDGVKMNRIGGRSVNQLIDPFLLLDEFKSEDANDYIGGFPPHPHRGFETITLMKQGRMEHEDHLGNQGVIESGDLQWMTAGHGVIHSEMPAQTEGKMHGFQLWLNLPASEKMNPADYFDLNAEDIPSYSFEGETQIRLVVGDIVVNDEPLTGSDVQRTVRPIIADAVSSKGCKLHLVAAENQNLMLYVYAGSAMVESNLVQEASLVIFSPLGNAVSFQLFAECCVLILGGIPLNEPIVQHGPFVMNTMDQIKQAIRDYEQGTLTAS